MLYISDIWQHGSILFKHLVLSCRTEKSIFFAIYSSLVYSCAEIVLSEINNQKLEDSNEGPSSRVTANSWRRAFARNVQFLLVYFIGSNITTQHSNFTFGYYPHWYRQFLACSCLVRISETIYKHSILQTDGNIHTNKPATARIKVIVYVCVWY